MNIHNVKVNGIKNPVGFALDEIIISYYFEGCSAEDVEVRIYDSPDRRRVLLTQLLDYRENFASKLNFTPAKETRYWFEIICGEVHSELCFFETGTDFDAPFVMAQEEIEHPVLFRSFSAKDVVRARMYVTGLGLYEARLNGQRVGEEYLTPYCNDYSSYVQYQTFDVTAQLKQENLLEISLGNGWYKGRFGLSHRENIYGNEYVAAIKLVLWHEDGTREVILTDENWKARPSEVVSSGIYDGEVVDYTRDTSHICGVVYAGRNYPVTERISLPVVIKEKRKPSLIVSPKGEYILDFGQNFSGFVSFRLEIARGKSVRLRAGETLQEGCFYRDNLRTAKAEYVYISDGMLREAYPKFTFFGFRYMCVEGLDTVDPDDFTGNVLYSDLDETVFVTTGNAKMDRLLLNCKWGQKSNFVDVPTDCAQRDERLGWTGDAEVFCPAACYQFDCRAFYNKYCHDMAIDQRRLNGGIASYSPSFGECEESGCVWSDAATIIPWTVYEFYGDKFFLLKHLPLMRAYVESLIRKDDENGGERLHRFGFCLGDWLSQDGVNSSAFKGATNEHFIASCYYFYSVKLLSRAESELGYTERANRYFGIAEEIRAAILREYFTSTGRLAVDTQTAYVLCVMFGIWVDRERLVSGFEKRMKKDGFSIKGGFVGATKLIQALLRAGLTEEAFRVVYSEKFPSWLYCVNLGATTIWERWNSLAADGSITDTTMNSLNHYSFGAVAEAFYRDIAGIVPQAVAFKKVTISPKFNYRLKDFCYRFLSPAGEFRMSYSILSDGEVHMNVTIPYGVEAELDALGKQISLQAGENVICFPSERKLVHPFSLDSMLCDVLDNEEARAAFREVAPALCAYFSSNDVGMGGYMLRTLFDMRSFFVQPQMREVLDEKLRSISK